MVVVDEAGNKVAYAGKEQATNFGKITGYFEPAGVEMSEDNKVIDGSGGTNVWQFWLDEGTIKTGVNESDLIVNDLPDGLTVNAYFGGTSKIITIEVNGTATDEITEVVEVTIIIKGSALVETGAEDSDPFTVWIQPYEGV